MRAYRPCAWWIEITAREEHSESLTSPESPSVTPREKMRKKRKHEEERNELFLFFLFLFFFCLLRIVFEHIWAHLFPHRESPVQLTWTISRETKALVEGGGGAASWPGGEATTTLSFNLIYSPLSLVCTWFSVTLTFEFRLSHLDVHNLLHYSTPPLVLPLCCLLYTVWLWVVYPPCSPRPPSLQSQQHLKPGQTETGTATESAENTSARRTAVMHLLDVFPLFFTLYSLSLPPCSPTTQPWQKLWHNDPRKLFRQVPVFNL